MGRTVGGQRKNPKAMHDFGRDGWRTTEKSVIKGGSSALRRWRDLPLKLDKRKESLWQDFYYRKKNYIFVTK